MIKKIGHKWNSRDKKHDAPKRSLAKTVTWRIIASVTTVSIIWFVTGEFTIAASAGAFEVVLKMFLYYGHERFWDRIAFGRDRRH